MNDVRERVETVRVTTDKGRGYLPVASPFHDAWHMASTWIARSLRLAFSTKYSLAIQSLEEGELARVTFEDADSALSSITDMAFLGSGGLACCFGPTVQLLDGRTGASLGARQLPGFATCLAPVFGWDSGFAVASSVKGGSVVQLMNAMATYDEIVIEDELDQVCRLAASGDGAWLAALMQADRLFTEPKEVRVWHISKGGRLESRPGFRASRLGGAQWIFDLALPAPADALLATASTGLWAKEGGSLWQVWASESGRLGLVASSSGRVVYADGDRLFLFNGWKSGIAPTRELECQLPVGNEFSRVMLTRDGSVVALARRQRQMAESSRAFIWQRAFG